MRNGGDRNGLSRAAVFVLRDLLQTESKEPFHQIHFERHRLREDGTDREIRRAMRFRQIGTVAEFSDLQLTSPRRSDR